MQRSDRQAAFRIATPAERDVPTYDFAGRPLRLVPDTSADEPSPLVDAILAYLEADEPLP